MASEFDFVIVGGGQAGLVVASRLSEDPSVSVLVIEAGEDLTADQRTMIPGMWTQLQSSSADWNMMTTPQKGLGGREVHVSQGRLLGGSAALNGMIFTVSSESNLDAWAQLGNTGWDWARMSKSAAKAYSVTTPSKKVEGGPIQLVVPEEKGKWPQTWRDTFAALGLPADNDPLSGTILGSAFNTEAIDPTTGTRSYPGNTYLIAARSRPNLTIWTQTLVEKVVLEKPSDGKGDAVAMGVAYRGADGRTQTVRARREVVLAAGVLHSPAVLELSGIGDAGLLTSLGIPVVVDNPHVGENLQNHVMSTLSFELADDASADPEYDTIDALARQDPAALAAAMADYARQTGPLARTNCNATGHLPFPGISTPVGRRDLAQLLDDTKRNPGVADDKTAPAFAQAHETYVRKVLQSPALASGYYFGFAGWAQYDAVGKWLTIPAGGAEKYFTIAVLLAHPLSRGSVHIGSASASDPRLAIDPKYLTHKLDVEVLARHVRFADAALASAPPLAARLKRGPASKHGPNAPDGGPGGFADDATGLQLARDFVRDTATGAAHFTGTCAMLPRKLGGVVDPSLRVYGVANLRVCDASVMPLTTQGNTMATVYAVAERGAEIIKAGL
ncbi:hypothetical protein B0T24DRAFT_216216 [Lasiosphaeria ovina]|uniref:Uncharacterized protein n=1 Tax=Lasiosphaeria ovina TaxID=92902 RepID=A0AAE0KG84_9PEZI|nr:hypothetical protein B0T24DRAFT_216216 [Lasiosphaeria ovina]